MFEKVNWWQILSGGAVGAIITYFFNKFKGRVQTMECYYISSQPLSQLPIPNNEGAQYSNLHEKRFKLVNTTNSDYTSFKIIFEFSPASKIINVYLRSKTGVKQFPGTQHKDNGYTISVTHFTRKNFVEFIFQIANLPDDDSFSVVEDDCIGFRIRTKDNRKRQPIPKMKVVSAVDLHRKDDDPL